MKKGVLLSVLIILVSIIALSQVWKGKARLIGYVFDEDGNPIEEVKVKLFLVKHKAGIEVMTDAKGMWVASWIRNGSWNIDFEKVGYETHKISVQISEARRNPEVSVNLKKAEGLLLTDELKAALNEGNKLFEEKKYEEAIAVYEKILADHPDAYIISLNIGNSYFQAEQYDKAEEQYRKVLEQDPDNNDAKLFIGNCYANRGDNEKALEWYNKIEFEKIKDPTVLYNIGTNFYNISKYQEALKYYKRAVEVKEDFTDGIYQLGLTYLTMQNLKESLAVFENYLKHDSDSPRASQVKNFIEFLKKRIG